MKPKTLQAFSLAFLLSAQYAAAATRPDDLGTLFRVNDENPKSNIPDEITRNAHPIEFGYYLQDLILRAEDAVKKQDWKTAVKYWDALANTVPDRAISFRRMCTAYEQLGEKVKAEGSCWAVLSRQGAIVEDHLHFVRLVLKQFHDLDSPKLTELRTKMADASMAHLREHLKAQPAPQPSEDSGESGDKALPLPVQVELLGCRLGALLKDASRLNQCVSEMKRVGADPKLVAPFIWAAATATGDAAAIAGSLKDARALGLPEATLVAMSDGANQFAAQRVLEETRLAAEKAAADKATLKKRLMQFGGGLLGLLTLGGLGWLFAKRSGAPKVPESPVGPAAS